MPSFDYHQPTKNNDNRNNLDAFGNLKAFRLLEGGNHLKIQKTVSGARQANW